MIDPDINSTYRQLSDSLALHRYCPAGACRRAKRCMQAQVDARMHRRVPRALRRLTDEGMMPCMARFAHELQTGDPVMRGVMDGIEKYLAQTAAAELDARGISSRSVLMTQRGGNPCPMN